jgi:N-methylhydantoinase A/oxoprolinase/acetone carboxylase beta subunit
LNLRIGIDVGGTHTDAVILNHNHKLIDAFKTPTTPDVTMGIVKALTGVLEISKVVPSEIRSAMLGTTHCINAVVERKKLAKVGLLRLGKPATMAVPPMVAFPKKLKQAIGDLWHIGFGGHEYDGSELSSLDEEEVLIFARKMRERKVEAIAVSSVFSPVNPVHEIRAAELIRKIVGTNIPITLSHEIGSVGLLERENAAILNAALVKVAASAINAFIQAMREAKIDQAQLFLTQNDGTLMSATYARQYPIRTIASGPTNSLRGAAFLTKLKEGLVVDIGGTTTLVSAIVNGFPRESAVAVEIGGVKTNFRMPDLISIGCGGGSIVRQIGTNVTVGPESVGYRLVSQGMAWGGDVLTATDVALASGYAKINDPQIDRTPLIHLTPKLIRETVAEIISKVVTCIEKMKTGPESVPIVLVGGGGIIIPPTQYSQLVGVSQVIRPKHFQFANAIGAAIAQVSGEVDRIFALEHQTRTEAISTAKNLAIADAIKAGADPESVEVVDIDEIPLAYLPGNAIRIRVKTCGRLLT